MSNYVELRKMTDTLTTEMIAANREAVSDSIRARQSENKRRFLRGDANAGSEYIYPNQINDASEVVKQFYEDDRRVISICKQTKVGANGFMIATAYQMTTHPDDDFVINPENVRFITGMSNKQWQDELENDLPTIFEDKVFHHGQLAHMNISNMRNGLIFIDEIDTGSDEGMLLVKNLEESGILDIEFLERNNIRLVIISATITRELYHAYRWGKYHSMFKMTIPTNYIGHRDFLKRGIIKEFYPIKTLDDALRWVKEDLVDNYGSDYRVGIIRTTPKGRDYIENACSQLKVEFRGHTSVDRIPYNQLKNIFETKRTCHMVIAVKNLWRRANLIPNKWKLKLGPTHELHTKNPDANVQAQGLPGRATGYWRDTLDAGHKTGPYRTSIKAIEQSINAYDNPFSLEAFNTRSFKKNEDGRVTKNIPSVVHPDLIAGLEATDAPKYSKIDTIPEMIRLAADDVQFLKQHKPEQSWDPYLPRLLQMIERISPGYLDKIPKVTRPKVLEPNEDARTKIIGRLEYANKNREQYNWNDGQVNTDTYKIYVDTVGSRLFISVCYGSKRNDPDTPQVANIPTF
jgi:hypothetical protein